MAVIAQSSLVDCTPRELFRYFARTSNRESDVSSLPVVTFHSVGPLLGKGQIIKLELSYGLFHVVWTSRITQYQPYEYFEDHQVDGPFRHWRHRHRFEEKGDKTLVHDEIDYEVGWGMMGQLMDRLVIRYQVDTMVKRRQEKATEKFQAVSKDRRMA